MVTIWLYDILSDQQDEFLQRICDGELTFIEGAECVGYTFPKKYERQVKSQLDTWEVPYHN